MAASNDGTAGVKAQVTAHGNAIALNRGEKHTEYLAYTNGGWWSLTKLAANRKEVLVALHDHNVDERLAQNPSEQVPIHKTPFADQTLREHDLDELEVEVDV